MEKYLYVVWLRDKSELDEDGKFYEWPSCVYIEAPTTRAAKHLIESVSLSYADENENIDLVDIYEDKNSYEKIFDVPVIDCQQNIKGNEIFS